MTNFLDGFSRTVPGDLTIWWFCPRTQTRARHSRAELRLRSGTPRPPIARGWLAFHHSYDSMGRRTHGLALLALRPIRSANGTLLSDSYFAPRMQMAVGQPSAVTTRQGLGLTGLALYALNRCCAQGMVTNGRSSGDRVPRMGVTLAVENGSSELVIVTFRFDPTSLAGRGCLRR